MQDCFVIRPPFGRTSYKQKNKNALESKFSDAFYFLFCDPCRIQTCNPHIRSVVLYSVELMDPERSPVKRENCPPPEGAIIVLRAKSDAKVLLFFDMTKFF